VIANLTTDYLGSLTIHQVNSATPLNFSQYVPPINGFGSMLNWDFKAFSSTSTDNARSGGIFVFEGMVGATYDIFSESFFDPFVLQLFDEQGNVLAKDDSSGMYGIDHIKYIAPYDGIYYLDASWHQGAADADKYATLSVYEDLDTISPAFSNLAPVISIFNPTNSAIDVSVDSNIVFTFDESIQRGSGFISLRTAQNVLVESFNVATSNNLSITGKTLTINPTNNLFISTQYFVTLEPGSIKDLAGNSNAEIQPYSFTTSSLIPDTSLNTTVNLDRIFNWGESIYPDLFSDHPESLDIFGYYARIYSNGNAIGEQNGDLYFYDGGLNGTGDIILIGTIADFFPQAISAGF